MIAEHEFVTTFEEQEAMAAARFILGRMGFLVSVKGGRLQAKRGMDKPAKAKRLHQLPQSVEMRYDRGRCHLAASIRYAGKDQALYRDMITTALTTLERFLVYGQTEDEALEAWRTIDNRAGTRTTQYSGARRALLVFLIAFLCLMALIIVIALATQF